MEQLVLNLQLKGTYKQQQTSQQIERCALKEELSKVQHRGLRCLEDLKQQEIASAVKLRFLRRKAERMSRVYNCLNEADVVSMISLNETIICLEQSLEYVQKNLALRERQAYLEFILSYGKY